MLFSILRKNQETVVPVVIGALRRPGSPDPGGNAGCPEGGLLTGFYSSLPIYITIKTYLLYSIPVKRASMKLPGVLCILLLCLGMALFVTGCTSPNAPASGSASIPSAPAAAATTPACPDKLVWDGEWQISWMGMAGNHDLSTAWTKYTDRPYGYVTMITMKQTCRDVETSMSYPNVKCNATFRGTIEKDVLSGTWSGSQDCSKGMADRQFSLTMAADNQSWLGAMYDSSLDHAKFPPNWAGRRPVK